MMNLILAEGSSRSMEKKSTSESRLRSSASRRLGPRQRIIKACFSCRRRKVRCDLPLGTRPCTKCVLDGFTCDVENRSHGRVAPRRYLEDQCSVNGDVGKQCTVVSVESSSLQSPACVRPQQQTLGHTTINFDQLFESFSQTSGIGDLFALESPAPTEPKAQIQPSCELITETPDCQDTCPAPLFPYYHSARLRCIHLTHRKDLDENSFLLQQLGFGLQDVCASVSSTSSRDYVTSCPFLKPARLDRLHHDDVEFLEQRGCFTLPPPMVLEVFLREYFLYVHPLLPVVDECAFWRFYRQLGWTEHCEHHISLFTFQAMLAVASTKLPLEILARSGFAGHRQACRTLFRRAKHLYDFRTEEDPLAIAEGALILSMIAPEDSMHQDNTMWLTIAIQYTKLMVGSQSLGEANPSPAWPKSIQRLWRCCLIRDRILSLGMRRPIQITPEHFDPSIALDWITVSAGEDRTICADTLIQDVDTQCYLANLHVAYVQFAIVLTDLLMMLYPHSNAKVKIISSLSQYSVFVSRVESCRADLNKWTTTFLAKFPDSQLPTYAGGLAVFPRSMLLLCQITASIALHQYEISTAYFYPGYINSYDSQRLKVARGNIYDSIQAMCNLTRVLQTHDLLSKLPPTAPACIAYPFLLLKLGITLQSTPQTPPLIITMWKTLQESMDIYKSRCANIDDVFSASWKFLQVSGQGEGPDTKVISLCPLDLHQHLTVKLQWCNDFQRNTEACLRASMTLDLNIARGIDNWTVD